MQATPTPATAGSPLESVLKRDRYIVMLGVVGVAALAWAYVVWLSRDMAGMSVSVSTPNLQSWGVGDWVSMFVMWAVMMTAMMIPSAAPMILLFATVNRRRRERTGTYVPTGIFMSGYILAWCGFAAAATVGNWALHINSLLNTMMGESTSIYLGGSLLVLAGVFQFSRLKYVCLTHCRSPLSFLMSDWREGSAGALKMGLHHGVYCVGCCWVLMSLLFVLGVMNIVWIAALAGFVLLEKVVPHGVTVSRVTGGALAGWGVLLMAGVIG